MELAKINSPAQYKTVDWSIVDHGVTVDAGAWLCSSLVLDSCATLGPLYY